MCVAFEVCGYVGVHIYVAPTEFKDTTKFRGGEGSKL